MKEGKEIIPKIRNDFNSQAESTKNNFLNLASILIDTKKIPSIGEPNKFEAVVIGNSIFKRIYKNRQFIESKGSKHNLIKTKFYSDMSVFNCIKTTYNFQGIKKETTNNKNDFKKYERTYLNPYKYLSSFSYFTNVLQTLKSPVNYQNVQNLKHFQVSSQSTSTLKNKLKQSISKPYYSDKQVVKELYSTNVSRPQYNTISKSNSIIDFSNFQKINTFDEKLKVNLSSKELRMPSSKEDNSKANGDKKYFIIPNINHNFYYYDRTKVKAICEKKCYYSNHLLSDNQKLSTFTKENVKHSSNSNIRNVKRSSDSLLEQIDKIRISKWE